YQDYLTENPKATQEDYLKSIDADIDSWYKADKNGTNATAEFLNKFMPNFEYNMGIKMDGFTELTKENQAEFDKMTKALDEWAKFSADAIYGNLSSDEIISQMTSLVDTLSDGKSTDELKEGLDSLLEGVTDTETQMRLLATLVKALGGDVDAIKAINEAILSRTGGGSGEKETTGTTVGNAAIDSFNKSLKEFNDARKTNDSDTMNKAGLDMYSWYLATWNDEADKFNRDMDTRASYADFIDNIDKYMNEFIRSSQAGHTNSAVHDSVLEQNLAWQQQQEKKRLEEEEKTAEYEKKKQELYEKYGDKPPEELLKELETETEEKNPFDTLLSMFEGDTLTQLTELIGEGGLGKLFGGVDADAVQAWTDLADPINQVADALMKLRDALIGTEEMKGLGTDFQLGSMFGDLDAEAAKAWTEMSSPIGTVADAMLKLRDALIGTQDMEGLGAGFKLSDLFPVVDEQTIESWNSLSGAIATIATSIAQIQTLFGEVAGEEGGEGAAGAGAEGEGEGGGMNLLTLLFGTPESIGAVMDALKGGEDGEGLTSVLEAISNSVATITGNFEAWSTTMQ
ncbi:MAG: hypothetical protein J6W04_00345, partial [Bacteroidales bacterium]|nr:hypothetical protein [Bacteroidales bacterium]